MSGGVDLEILKQLGGNKFRVMTGAKDFVGLADGLMFGLPNRKINKVRIRLNGKDLYDIEFMKVNFKKAEVKTVKLVTDVYNDKLAQVFEQVTGLATKLF